MQIIYEMSIEDVEGHSFRDGYHLGTDEKLARELIVERFHGRVRWNMPTVTIALMDGKRILDVYMGDKWTSDI